MTPEAQRMVALAAANRARRERAVLKARVRSGSLRLADAFLEPAAAGMSVFALLQAQRYWGSSGTKSKGWKATRVLKRAGVSPGVLVGALTVRQRGVLVEIAEAQGTRRAA